MFRKHLGGVILQQALPMHVKLVSFMYLVKKQRTSQGYFFLFRFNFQGGKRQDYYYSIIIATSKKSRTWYNSMQAHKAHTHFFCTVFFTLTVATQKYRKYKCHSNMIIFQKEIESLDALETNMTNMLVPFPLSISNCQLLMAKGKLIMTNYELSEKQPQEISEQNHHNHIESCEIFVPNSFECLRH